MALIVTKVSQAFYTAMVSPPHTREAWKTEEPLRMHQLCDQLLVLGLHQSDIGDAINQADREWLQQTLEIRRKPQPGEMVMLRECPAGLLDGLPREDQDAISDIVGKPILLNEYDGDGRAELEFADRNGVLHFVFVKPEFITLA